MTDERWQRTWEIFHHAVDLEGDERDRFLADSCADEVDLRTEVERLIAAHEHAPSLLDQPSLVDKLKRPDGADLVGAAIGNYQIEAQLGEGGMGVVYRARQTAPIERIVAFKVIHLGMNTREVIARFEVERRTLARLEHPNIARVLDAGATEDGRPFFVMEFVDGRPLTRFCDERRLSTRERLALFVPICRAIHHAHQKGVIHRDLKPSNVLVAERDGRPEPKIIDFGIARAVDREQTEATFFTAHGRLVGTPEYMSPEQADMSHDLDIRTDIYSLGVLLYEVLAGCLPFASIDLRKAALEHVRTILRGETPKTPSTRVRTLGDRGGEIADRRRTDPASLRRELRGDLDWIVMRAMEKERSRRYDAASELAEEIERHLRHEPVAAGPPSASYRLSKLIRRHRVATVMTAIACLALVSLSVHATWQAARTRHALARAEIEAARARSVATFLIDLFESSEPSRALGETILAREILDRGAEKIEQQLEQQPAVQASMMSVMGDVYTRLGLLDEAESLLAGSVAHRRSLYDETHPEMVDGIVKLATLKREQGEYEEAEALLRACLDALVARFGEDDARAADVAHILGGVLIDAGALDDAEGILRRVLSSREQSLGHDHRETSSVRGSLGVALLRLGRFEAAEPHLRSSLVSSLATLDSEHPEVAERRSLLASVLKETGAYDEAGALLESVLATRRRVFGDDHSRVAEALNNLAGNHEHLGNLEAAEAAYQESLDTWRRAVGERHPNVAFSLANLGTFYRRTGKLALAEDHLRQALAIRRAILDPDHPDIAVNLNNLGAALERQDRPGDALALYLESLEIRRRSQGDEHPSVAATLSNLGVVYRKLGQLDQAETHYRQAIELETRILGPDHPNLAIRQRNLGALLVRREQLAAATEHYVRATEILRAAFGDQHPRLAFALAELGLLLIRQDRHAEAEVILREALAIQHEGSDALAWQTGRTRTRLGGALVGLERYAEAEAVLEQALLDFETVKNTPRDYSRFTLDAMVRLYVAWGRPERASMVREQLKRLASS